MSESKSDIAKANADAMAVLEDLHEDGVTEYAREIAPDMIKVVEKIARGAELPGKQRSRPAEMHRAAVEIIDRAQGRPGIRKGEIGEGAGGVTIHIHTPGLPEEKIVNGRKAPVTEADLVKRGTEAAIEVQEALHAGQQENGEQSPPSDGIPGAAREPALVIDAPRREAAPAGE